MMISRDMKFDDVSRRRAAVFEAKISELEKLLHFELHCGYSEVMTHLEIVMLLINKAIREQQHYRENDKIPMQQHILSRSERIVLSEQLKEKKRVFEQAINMNNLEIGSDTPDFILGEFLQKTLEALDSAVNQREFWYGRKTLPMNEKS